MIIDKVITFITGSPYKIAEQSCIQKLTIAKCFEEENILHKTFNSNQKCS
jgi:hypothetical protein